MRNLILPVLLYLNSLTLIYSIPHRGNYPWTVILCKFRDIPDEPRPPEWFQKWVGDEVSDGSILRYFNDVSNGLYSIRGSNVLGWYTLPFTKENVELLARRDPYLNKLTDIKLKIFYKTKEVCLEHAKRTGAQIHENIISVINDEHTAVFCKESGVLLTPRFLLSSALSHEMTHSFNIGHSYSDKPIRIFPYSSVGEYDDKYDLMSTANAYMYRSLYGMSGPGLNGPHLDYLGWLPSDRVLYFGKEKQREGLFRLASLSAPHRLTRGYLLLLLPYDRDNPLNVYTIEFRTPNMSDKGIHRGAVVIHKIQKKDGYYFSYLVTHGKRFYELVEGTEWLEILTKSTRHGDMYIRVKFVESDLKTHSCTVHVISTFSPSLCQEDEVHRATNADDFVCVSETARAIIESSTANHSERVNFFGACLAGYVRRRAMTRDDVCVTPAEKRQVDEQNRHWHRRKQFYGFDTYGQNSCHPGYVWRQIDAYDYVCVTPTRRDDVLHEDVTADVHRDTHSGACLRAFVTRKAFYGDDVCVSPQAKTQAERERRLQKNRLVYYGFFNGIDDVEL